MEYSLFVRDIESSAGKDVLDTCRELGITVVCYSPLGRGLLTGTFSKRESVTATGDMRATHMPRFSEENIGVNAKITARLGKIAEGKGCTASQLAIAWLLKQGKDIIPNPGTKKMKYLEENLAALNVNISDQEEKEIRTFMENVEIQGSRTMPGGEVFERVDTVEE